MTERLYFAYGSNMSTRRLQQRVRVVEVVTVAWLEGHRLKFHKKSHDGSAKCDIEQTGVAGDRVYGVVFRLPASDKPALDAMEDLGRSYAEKRVVVNSPAGEQYEAFTYYALVMDPYMKPYTWYKEHVLRGAREHHLPPDYIDRIERVAAEADADTERHAGELVIYDDLREA